MSISLWPPDFVAAIFDFDGTISDTAALWHEVDVDFLAARGIPYDPGYPKTLSTLGFTAGAEYTIRRFHLDERPEDICEEWTRMGRALYAAKARLRPGAQAYIERLRACGVRVGLATTNSPEVLHSMRSVDVHGLFDVVVTSSDCAVPKDRPDIYLMCADRLQAEPGQTMVFEDIKPGLQAARGAGFLTCGVRSGDPNQQVEEVREAAQAWLDGWEGLAG